ncbi:VRR-NUC domain-containing protein [Intestinibacter sp.]|uniref:VRR-NUC domain-containing protein n=1 Tax=Intestinibacter sp. TaxID=1965304 RepID=UPI002A751B96|nr:VRR-NUC domain-containing protein [Intestinibacter sp.]MDY2734395.1 VRR-NUC domain-containing protein [Intestinibacter sp.]
MQSRYALDKNGEGYKDSTACKAIKRADNKLKATESGEQQALIQWADLQSHRHKELKMLVHIPNEGKRSIRAGAELKRMGLRAGFPDLFLAVPKLVDGVLYGGLFIEMKVKGNKCTENQKKWLRRLSEQGYKTEVCYGCSEAIEVIKDYLGI